MPDFDQALGAPRRRQSGTDSAQRRQSLTEAARAEHWLGRILRHYGERAPFINFFYYLFFRYRSSPKYADILGQLEGMLLFSALMFTIAVSLPMALERDELLMAERDYHHGGVYGCTVEPGERFPYTKGGSETMSEVMAYRTFASSYFCGVALFLTFFMFISLSSINCVDVFKEEAQPKRGSVKSKSKKLTVKRSTQGGTKVMEVPTDDEVIAWWKWGKWPIVVSVFCLMIATITTFTAWGLIANVKLPNTYYRTLCKEAGWVYSHVDDETGSRIFVNGTIVSRPGYPFETFGERQTCPEGWYIMWGGIISIVVPTAFFFAGYGVQSADYEKHPKKKDSPYFVCSIQALDNNKSSCSCCGAADSDDELYVEDHIGTMGRAESTRSLAPANAPDTHGYGFEASEGQDTNTMSGFNGSI